MRIHVVAFASLREAFASSTILELPPGSSVADAWAMLAAAHPRLGAHAQTLRFARNGRMAAGDETLADDDELALLPPVGGG